MPVIKEVTKLWGTELWHHNDTDYCMKTLVLRHGAVSSKHWHRYKTETFLVVRGRVVLEIGVQAFTLLPGDSITLHAGALSAHRFRAIDPEGATVIEASTMHDDDDVVRIEPSRLL